ncbi:MAG: pyruvate dehydrogenase (acetyl-transferring) E1 component subunit alpha [Flavobacteriales bacterium]|jgi:pyruvate dehydrogenase E1 component alpha subunit|nr:MAG: pyruvate dehydrogenase (acetyl-transferring) E1 component subunit alpha [Flavobacteriales bacterium]
MSASTITFDRATGLKHLERMLLVRRFEEACAEQYTKGHIRGFLHLCIGQEAVNVGVLQALGPQDNILSTYREHGHALARGIAPDAIMAELFGRQEGSSRGRGGSMHLFDKAARLFGGNAIVAGHLPVAVGLALAAKRLKESRITCCIFGEGAAAEGAFHEAMNLASLWQLPLLFVCENNRYAMGTALHYSHAVEELAGKGPAYGIASASIDGMDLSAVIAAANEAVRHIRDTGSPYFLVCNTYRFRAHSMFDAELYRDKAEVEEWKKRDPIPAFRSLLIAQGGITEADVKEAEQRVEDTVKAAVAFAERGTWEPVEELTRHMTSDH